MHLKVAIALLSAAAIGYEILLIRIFAIIQWHHFAAMVLSLALLGYGVSGTTLTLARDWLRSSSPGRWKWIFFIASSLFGVLAVACAVVAQWIPFNPLAVLWEPSQWFQLLSLSMALTVPFFLAGTAIGVALMSRPGSIGGLYGADLVGAGLGAAVLLMGLYLLPIPVCLQGIGVLGCLAAGVFLFGYRTDLGSGTGWLWLVVGLAIVLCWPRAWLDLRISEYKGLHKALLVPGVEIILERSSPLGLLTVVSSPQIPFRHAPGLSLQYTGSLPPQLGVFTDGQSMTVINDFEPSGPQAEFLDFLPSAVPFWLRRRPSVLILGAGGGTEIALALRHGAAKIEAVEANPHMLEILRSSSVSGRKGVLEDLRVETHAVEPRSFLRRTTEPFDVILIPIGQSLAASTGGAHALGPGHLFTVESFSEILRTLQPEGLVVVHNWLKIPPRENLKLVATLMTALKHSGVQEPQRNLAQIRDWATVVTLVKRSPLRIDEMATIARFSHSRSFDLSWLPGLTAEGVNIHHSLREPYLFQGIHGILEDPDAFFRDYKFEIRPATDDRPFFSHTFKWRSLPELLTLGSRAGVPLVEWGYLVLIATILQAVLVSVALILIPLRLVNRSGPGKGSVGVLVYFSCLGMGFMLLELAFIQRFTLFLGQPTLAVAVVLAAFLISAGLGSAFTRLAAASRSRREPTARQAVGSIVALGTLYWLGLPHLMSAALALPAAARVAITLIVVAPLGFLLGMPFPLGLRAAAARRPVWVPWAWGINGTAAVVGAAAAPAIAMHLGYSSVILLALAFYALAAVTPHSRLAVGHVMRSQEE